MATDSHRRERRAAAVIVVAALAVIALGTTWDRACGPKADLERDTTVLARVPARGSDGRASETFRLREFLQTAP